MKKFTLYISSSVFINAKQQNSISIHLSFWIQIGIISTTTLILLTSEWITSTLAGKHDGVGYSYARFSGPVSGPEKEIIVHDKVHHKSSVDYVAKPDYSFAYGVEDPKSKVSQSRKEERHGDQLVGEYR